MSTISINNDGRMYLLSLHKECSVGSARTRADAKSALLKALVKLNVFTDKELREVHSLALGTHVLAPNLHSHSQIDRILSSKIEALLSTVSGERA